MRFIPPAGDPPDHLRLIFELTAQEKVWLIAILSLYPLLDASSHEMAKSNRAELQASPKLLQETMDAERLEYRKKLDQFLAADSTFKLLPADQFQFTLTREQADWLLRILNDIRVGSWIKLGRPETTAISREHITEQNSRHVIALQLSGLFQEFILRSMSASH